MINAWWLIPAILGGFLIGMLITGIAMIAAEEEMGIRSKEDA